MFYVRFTSFKFNQLPWLFSREILPLLFSSLCLIFLLVVLGGFVRFFWIVGRRYLENGINEKAKIWLLMSNSKIEVLVDLVKSLWVDAFGEIGVLLCPIFKDGLESRANSGGFLEQVFAVLVEKELEAIGDKHKIEDEIFVFGLIAGDTNNIPNLFRVLSDETIFDVPIGFLDHVRKENGFNLIHEKDLGDGFEHLVHGVPEGDVAATGY